MDSKGLIVELAANTTIPGKQLEAIMTAYPTCWGYAAPTQDKQGNKRLTTGTMRLPEGCVPKDIQDMKAQLRGTPEMMEFFGKFPDNTDDVCMQPFPLLEDDKGNTKLCLFMEGDFGDWAKEDEPNHSPEYICYRDKISPLVNSLSEMLGGNVNKIVKKLGQTEFQDILAGTFGDRGVIYFLSDGGDSQLIEGNNDKRKDEDWGGVSNDIPEVPATEEVIEEKEEVVEEPVKELSLAEKRKLRQANADNAAKQTVEGVRNTTASPKPVNQQAIKSDLKNSTAAPAPKGPFLFTLPQSIKTEAEAKTYWQTNFGTCPDMWKHKQADGTWIPSYTAGFPHEKSAKNSIIRDKFNPDGSLKSGGKGFAALDDVATGKGPTATAIGPHPDAPRHGSAPSKLPIIPSAVRDKVLEELLKLDLKSRKIMSNEEIKTAEAKHSTFHAQLNNQLREELWRLSYEEIDKLNRTYPDFGSGWIFALRSFEMQNYKPAQEPKKEETVDETVQPELTLAEKRALRKKAAA